MYVTNKMKKNKIFILIFLEKYSKTSLKGDMILLW